MFSLIIQIGVVLLLIAILRSVQHGFNEVIKGLQAIHDRQRSGSVSRPGPVK